MELVIGNKNYSSWSLRGWLMLKAFDIPFHEKKLQLFSDSFYQELESVTPMAKVPVLIDGGVNVWDSLAICEYVSEKYLEGKGWPKELTSRALARAAVAEMHSGFSALRNEMPMNCRAKREVLLSDQAQVDVERIDQLWQNCLTRVSDNEKTGWLFGEFSIADVFYAPVALRFKTYGIELSDISSAYVEMILNYGPVMEWVDGALSETEIVPEDEAGEER